MPLRIVIASFGPIPLTVMSFSKSLLLSWPEKPVERDQIFTHVSVDVQRDFASHIRQIRKCRPLMVTS